MEKAPARKTGALISIYLQINMTNATDSDLQQIKDLIAALDKKMEVGFAKLEGKIDNTNTEIKGIHAEIADIKSNQKAQDTRFWALIFLIISTLIGAIGAIGRIAKLY